MGVGVTAAEQVRTFAPGRVNLIGEHVDYNDGIVLPIAIERGCTATVSTRTDGLLVITSAQRTKASVQVSMADLAPAAVTGWAAYPAGAVWAVLDGAAPTSSGLSVHVNSDVPSGAGLSSSAALTCSVATAVNALLRLGLAPRDLARCAQRAENAFVGVPTGAMDQVASTLAVVGHALMFDVRDDTVTPVRYALPGTALLVIDTGVHHALVDGGYAQRRAACERAAALLGVRSLRGVVDVTALNALLGQPDADELLTRSRHVVSEIARVPVAADALARGDAGALGALMCASHASLRDDFAVSCVELDTAVDAAMAAGALGARMTGGGFGGSAIALVPEAYVARVTTAVMGAFSEAGFAAPRIWPVRPGGGARVLAG